MVYCICNNSGGIIGYLLDHYCADILTKPEIIGCALIFMGIILYITDKKAKSKVKYEEMSFKTNFFNWVITITSIYTRSF